jgi:trk system potassium uptake protein TrkH
MIIRATKRGQSLKNFIIQKFAQSPSRAPILGFLILIAIGAVLLSLPAASATGERTSLIDAVFTATSASCVTGLITLDTGSDFSLFGQLIILTLIQIGGIGIMSISTLFLLLAGMRAGFIGRLSLQDSFTHSGEYSPLRILKSIVVGTLSIEAFGALLMFGRFAADYPIGQAAYLSIFHSISAFCNAGFSLFPESLVNYRHDWIINMVISGLIITGGLGFLVMSELRHKMDFSRRSWERLSLHTKLVLSATAILLCVSTLFFLTVEWNNSLAGLPIAHKTLNAAFQAVTTRTAGFNTINLSELSDTSLFMTMVLMFVGACPGSTGGGIKITTVATLALMGVAALTGREHPQVFKRSISENSISKALSLSLLGLGLVCIGTILLSATEMGSTPHTETNGRFIELAFEMVSAFGTAGLSTGVTPTLSGAGKILITLMMFIGRLGPLSIAFAISRQKETTFRYAEEKIMIG